MAFGQLTEKNGTTYVRYEETKVTGMEGTRTTLKWTEDSLTVIRHGRYEHRQQYERGRNSTFQYRTPYFTVPMTVFTRSLAIDRQEHSWKVRLSYDLEMDNQPSGRICLRMRSRRKKSVDMKNVLAEAVTAAVRKAIEAGKLGLPPARSRKLLPDGWLPALKAAMGICRRKRAKRSRSTSVPIPPGSMWVMDGGCGQCPRQSSTMPGVLHQRNNQMHNLALSVNARYLELFNIPCEFPEKGYHGEDIKVTARRIRDKYGDKFIHMSEEERLEQFQTIAKEEKLAALKEDLEAFNCEFDVWFSEQSLHDANKINQVVDELQEKGYVYEKEGAKWFRSTAFGDDKDRVVIRDNGVSTYFAADIAYHQNKFQRGFDRVINLWGADHHGYIPRVKAAMQALGYDPERLEVLILQMVALYRNGQLVKMSKRTGKSVTLNELIEEVGTDAARFFFIMRSMDSQLDFDLTLATEHSMTIRCTMYSMPMPGSAASCGSWKRPVWSWTGTAT